MGRKPPSGRQSGQRAISSFLFKPQPQPAQPSGDSRTAPEPTPSRSPATASPGGPPPAEASGPPAKRARFFPPPSAENGDAHVAGNPSTAVPQPAKLAAGPKQAPTKDNHQRFQNKLVHGIGNRKHGDSNTIVPQKHTPLELQVVDLKQKHPGVLLAVEVGYKFRFFGEDAEIASKECNLFCYPDRNFMTASIPLPRLHVYVRRLVEAGHKVGIVRQTETAAIKASGDNKYTPFQRRLTALYTQSTLEAGSIEDVGESLAASREGSREGGATNEQLSRFMVCIVESPSDETSQGGVEMGMVAVETSTGAVFWDAFRDGMLRANLEARLMYTAPSELLVAQPLSAPSTSLLGSYATASCRLRSEAVPADKYRGGGALAAVTAFYGRGDQRALDTAMALPALVLQALAHALDYLKAFNLETVLRVGAAFQPLQSVHEMSLSPNTLCQLEVLRNSEDGGERGSLLWLLDHTCTPMGGRLLRHWTAHPLCHAPHIQARLDAVQELAAAAASGGAAGGPLAGLGAALQGLPDLERGITRLLHRTASPSEFLAVLQALSGIAQRLRVQVDEGAEPGQGPSLPGVSSQVLQQHLAAAASRQAAEQARGMLSAVDEAAAQANDLVRLFRSDGRFPDITRCRHELEGAQDALQGLLPALRKRLHLPRLDYVSIVNQGDYMIEVPAERSDIPRDWEKVSSTKKTNRFHPPEVLAGMEALSLATEHLQAAAKAAWHAFLTDFAALYLPFRSAVQALAALDALHSLAVVAQGSGYVRPEFVGEEEEPQLVVRGGRHPVLDAVMDEPVVPNSTTLRGLTGPRAAIITGPNMGGKSCYIRQAALIALMAQVGSLVPAESARLHVLDAIYTRMGASDNLARGRSTFLEELSETSAILAKATARSLVIIDELGRGTSTHDGVAIAHATLQHLVSTTQCLTLFVTHYPKVASVQEALPGMVAAFFMSYLQEGEALQPTDGVVHATVQPRALTGPGAPIPKLALPSTASGAVTQARGSEPPGQAVDPSPRIHVPKITFLYRLAEGVADRSFGLNVARMAQLPTLVIDCASRQAAAFEAATLERLRAADEQKLRRTARLRLSSALNGMCNVAQLLSCQAPAFSELQNLQQTLTEDSTLVKE